MTDQPRIAVVGTGLAGCLLATLLARRGLEVTVYERREDPRRTGPERGRSINLAVSARGLDALERVGLREESLGRALPMHGRMIHSVAGAESFRPYSADRQRAINSISRAELNASLLDVAEKTPGVTLQFGYRLRELNLDTGQLSFETSDGHRRRPHADIVLATDGSYSAARRAVTFRQDFTFSQDYLDAGYKELTIPATPDGEFALDPDALHIWPRGESMMIALPNLDRSFTCTLFWPKADFAKLETDAQIRDYFARNYPDAAPVLLNLVEDFRQNPVGSLVTVKCWPWVHRGERVTLALVGDAAHAIVPFFGQGANCALEDCVEIDRCLDESGGDWQRALDTYQGRRKANCDAIAEMALDNFVEMRDRVNSRVFQAKTAAQHALERRLPGHYVSRYELVSFTTMPYAQIPDRMRRQNRATAATAAGLGVGVVAGGSVARAMWRRIRRR
ncbi:MAG TPA: NAD(P)/FAD-dependent oxidoreductase [Jatrophihabitantaceae bacterium]|nr:NAD(P)/FAD-dependent oxidoreductase [Jatrophihabitantaceae bacterium]